MTPHNSIFKWSIAHSVHILLGICTTLTFFCISLVIFLAIFPIRQLVKLLLRYAHKNRFQLMDPIDAVIGTDGRIGSQLITSYFLAQNQFSEENLEKLRSKLYYNIVSGNYGKLRLVPCTKYGFRCWEGAGSASIFDIQAHLKLCPGIDPNRKFSEAEFMSILNNVVNSSILSGKNTPNWELLVVPQVLAKPKGAVLPHTHIAVIIRMGHGYMDGTSFINFIRECIFDEQKEKSYLYPSVVPVNGRKWNFFRTASFYIKIFVFGILNSVAANLVYKNPAYQQGSAYSGEAFIGKIQVTAKSVRNIRKATKCQTNTAAFATAFLSALRSCGDAKGVETVDNMERMSVALTRVLSETFRNDTPQNRFAFYFRRLQAPLTESLNQNLRQILESASDLIHISQDNDYEYMANFYLTWLTGLLPDWGIRIVVGHCNGFTCTVSFTPFSNQIFSIQGAPVTSFVAAPPHARNAPYVIVVTNYGGEFIAAVFLAKTELITSLNEFQDLLSRFKDCFNLFEEIVTDSSKT